MTKQLEIHNKNIQTHDYQVHIVNKSLRIKCDNNLWNLCYENQYLKPLAPTTANLHFRFWGHSSRTHLTACYNRFPCPRPRQRCNHQGSPRRSHGPPRSRPPSPCSTCSGNTNRFGLRCWLRWAGCVRRSITFWVKRLRRLSARLRASAALNMPSAAPREPMHYG